MVGRLPSEGAAQGALVGAGVVGKRVERHLGIEAVAQVLDRAALVEILRRSRCHARRAPMPQRTPSEGNAVARSATLSGQTTRRSVLSCRLSLLKIRSF